jgi:hypothetical protein
LIATTDGRYDIASAYRLQAMGRRFSTEAAENGKKTPQKLNHPGRDVRNSREIPNLKLQIPSDAKCLTSEQFDSGKRMNKTGPGDAVAGLWGNSFNWQVRRGVFIQWTTK